jgi:cytoskeletal protein CcmA (bactofilin family)
MWRKDEGQSAQAPVASPTRATTTKSQGTPGSRAIIGPSICIRGDVTGSEDLLIQGQVDGSVTLDLHAVSVGSEGRVNADIRGRVILVEGTVEGDLIAKEQIVLRGTARVMGDIKAPRVVLEDGATFRGLVDMASAPPNGNYPGPGEKTATPKARTEAPAKGNRISDVVGSAGD